MTTAPSRPVHLDGTVRAAEPEVVWRRLAPELDRYGITRVADLTRLDHLDIPVAAAYRPASRTLSVSQGKGATLLLAKISAVLEAIELWHAEQPRDATWRATARDVHLPYPLSALPLRVPWHDALDRLEVDWTTGTGLLTGRTVPIPLDLVHRTAHRAPDIPHLFRATSTGLACGTTRDEAVLHALYEIAERDTLHRDHQAGHTARRLVDPRTVTAPHCCRLLEHLDAAHAFTEIALVPGPYRLPVAVAYLWTEDYPLLCAGAGCHTDPDIALSRAITEAAQSRLTCITGTRDDLPTDPVPAGGRRPATTGPLADWTTLTRGFPPHRGHFADEAQDVAARIAAVTGHEPVRVDLDTAADPHAAVHVIAPGTRTRTTRAITR
jgi:ribosomal protein S12 methylthiotransferase accessory factor